MTDWAAGMRCVCVREFLPVPGLPDLVLAKEGVVYTVREVAGCTETGEPVLYLVEIDNRHMIGRLVQMIDGPSIWQVEPAFESSRFRPLSETRLDQFRQHLAPSPRETEDA